MDEILLASIMECEMTPIANEGNSRDVVISRHPKGAAVQIQMLMM